MIGPRGDGLDVDAVLADAELTRDVPAEHVDIVIALVTAYFLKHGRRARAADVPAHPRTRSGGRARCAGTGSASAAGWPRLRSIWVARAPRC